MKTILFVLATVVVTAICEAQDCVATKVFPVYVANDSLLIDVRNISKGATQTISIYVLDAGLDRRVNRLCKVLEEKPSSVNYRIIGIGHSRFSNKKRRRDFIPPGDTTFFGPKSRFVGKANDFLSVIVDSIIPTWDTNTHQRILIGHSFGGLFGVYCGTLATSPFDEIFALSPSLWVNAGSFRRHYVSSQNMRFYRQVYIAYGSLEVLNFVGLSINRLRRNVKTDDKKYLYFSRIPLKTHFSMIRYIKKLQIPN